MGGFIDPIEENEDCMQSPQPPHSDSHPSLDEYSQRIDTSNISINLSTLLLHSSSNQILPRTYNQCKASFQPEFPKV